MTDAPAVEKVVGHVVMEVSDVERALAEAGPLGLRRLLLWPVLLAFLFLISLLTNSDTSWDPRRTILPVVLGLSFWVGLLLYARKSAARKTLEGKAERDRSITFELDPAGYSISTPTSSSRSEWSNVYRSQEGKSAFLLYLNPTIHQILPKRAFSDDDVPKVRALLAAHVTQRPAGSRRTAMILLWAVLIVVFLAIWQFVSMPK